MGFHHSDTATSSVCRCNKLFGTETLHPLASVIALDDDASWSDTRLDCYAVYMADKLPWGHDCPTCTCDYSDAAVWFAPPGYRVAHGQAHGGRLLLFHPDLMECEGLGRKISQYHFFHYDEHEALHLSRQEQRQVQRCIDYIDEELHWGVDRFSCALLCNKIELLLNYCQRYHCRQLLMRHDLSQEAIARLTRKADAYLREGHAESHGLPTKQMVAQWTGHSAAYADDMMRHETGCDIDCWMGLRRIEVAKQMLLASRQTTAQIARTLGFPGEACFAKLFTKVTGCTPERFRS